MPLFLADIHLYRAMLFHDEPSRTAARRLLDRHGYGRRPPELEDDEAARQYW